MPNEEFTIDDKNIKYGFFHGKTKFNKQVELFPSNGRPSILDVKQGHTDLDCYFLSVLGSLANTEDGKEKIMACFPDYTYDRDFDKRKNWFQNLKKIKVRFFKPDSSGNVVITVDKTALRKKGAPWVRLLEKAFAFYKTKYAEGDYFDKLREDFGKKGVIKSRIIDGIKGADSAFCAAAITGETYARYAARLHNIGRRNLKKFSDGPYDPEVNDVYENIRNGLDSKKSVVASSAGGRVGFSSKGLFLNHIYTVLDAFEKNGKKFIRVRNPYAGSSRVYKQGKDKKMHSKAVTFKEEDKKGISDLELNDFCKYFDYYTIGTRDYLID